MDQDIVLRVVTAFIPFLFALCVHEFAHGWVANKLGDPTAKLMGRLTLNPMAHADILGTIALPLIRMVTGVPLIGWAKPVPVNSRNLRNQKTGMFWVASAGPGSNLIMAMLGSLGFVVSFKFGGSHGFFFDLSKNFIIINLALAFFNLIPLHPLDGAKIFEIFFPASVNRKLEEMQMYSGILLLVLFMTGVLGKVLGYVIEPTFYGMINAAAYIVGLGGA
jgi:Zn-dependent protease